MNIILIILAVVFIAMLMISKKGNKGVTKMNPSGAIELLKNGESLILDVRSSQEFKSGHLKGAKLIPLDELSLKINDIASYKDKPVLVYCHSGGRSSAASQILVKNGFVNVNNLQGGITAWIHSGNTIVK